MIIVLKQDAPKEKILSLIHISAPGQRGLVGAQAVHAGPAERRDEGGVDAVSYTHLSSVTFATGVASRFSSLARAMNLSTSSGARATATPSSCLLYTSRCV